MKQFKEKLLRIYLPYLAIITGFILLYTFLNWTLFVKSNLISLNQTVINFWLPLTLPAIPAWIWLWPRIKLLEYRREDGAFVYLLLAVISIAAPTIIAQEYLEKASGTLTPLTSISQFEPGAATKYYSLKKCYADKMHAGIHPTATVSGKQNETLKFQIFVTLPLYEKATDTASGKCKYWLGTEYSKSISNRGSDEDKDERYKAFALETQKVFDTTDFTKFVYLERLSNTDNLEEFKTAVKKDPFVASDKPVIFVAYHEPFEKRTGETFEWIFISFGFAVVVVLILILIPDFDDKKLHRFREGIKDKEDSSMKEVLAILVPRKGYYVTPIIIDLNILLYLIMVFAGLGIVSFKAEDLLHWGGNFRPLVEEGQWWRLLTNTFLHGGLMHIVANMVGLLFVGLFLEPAIGTKRFAIFYVATGILASIASIWWHAATVSVGASGAIFGMYGVFLALLLRKVFPAELNKAFLTSTLVFVGFNLVMGLAGGIDNAAHIGGLVSGFVIGLIIAPTIKGEIEQKSQEEAPEDVEAEMYS